jgi:UDP-N-acetyl-D-mannosaminuronic acid dehydrogenase
MKIGVLGLGFVGLTLAVKLSEKGFNVLGIEKDRGKLELLKDGRAPFQEPGLDMQVSTAQKNGKLCVVHPADISNNKDENQCDIIIVTVGTPVVNEQADLSALRDVKPIILKLLKADSVVALRSTVAVGTCRNYEAELLAANANFLGVCSVPERTAEGVALQELEELPQIVGANSKKVAERIIDVFSQLASQCIELNSTEEAEFSKLISNCYRDFSFSIANLFQFAAEDLNLDGERVIKAVNYRYPRASIPRPGPVAGPCLEKDAYIFAASLNSSSADIKDLVIRLRKNNESIVDRIVARVFQYAKTKSVRKICICGIAFKGSPTTDDIRGSLSIPVAVLLKETFELVLQDYQYSGDIDIAGELLPVQQNIPEDVDLYILMNNHKKYENFQKDHIDAWG